MTKMISTQAHRYAGVELGKFETFDVDDERYVETLIMLGRAEIVEEPEPEPEPEPKAVAKPTKKTRRKHYKVH